VATQGPATETGSKAVKTAKTARPAPQRTARPSGGTFVGIDIGSHSIKAVEVKGYGPGLTVTGYGITRTPAGAIQAGRIADPKALGNALKSFLSKNNIRSNKIIASVAGADGVVVRVIEVPKMTPTELKEAMRYEVERSIPFAITDVEMDYQALDNSATADDPNNPNMEVLFAAAQREIINRLLAAYQAAGQDVKAIDVEPLAIGRSMINLSRQGMASKNVVVINIGASLSEVCIFKDGLLRFPRTIPIAGDSFTRAIADQLGITEEEAEDEKKKHAAVLMEVVTSGTGTFVDAGGDFDFAFDQPMSMGTTGGGGDTTEKDTGSGSSGDTTEVSPYSSGDTTDQGIPPQLLANPDDPFAFADSMNPSSGMTGGGAPPPVPTDPMARKRRELFDALSPVLSEFAMEVRRSVDYFRSRYPSETVDQILLCGGSAKLPGLDKYIEYEVGVATSVGDPFQNVNVQVRQQLSGVTRDEVAPAFAVALGLAERDAVLGSGR
jgi:type IV pilus assembly protein PilM